jgi:UDP-N-acetylmuramoylalanine--D-glutamate ligase
MFDFKGKTVLVLGMGSSGMESAKFLAGKSARVRVSESADTPALRKKAEELRKIHVDAEIGGHTAGFFKDCEAVVVSPGINVNDPALKSLIPADAFVIGELELGYMFCRAPVVAITGTNGKSTTTELLGDIFTKAGLKTAVCGNIGIPFISKAETLDEKSVAVVEVSSFQLETIRTFRPKVAILLNITEDHYERHGNFENYKAEKFKVFANQDASDLAVVYSELKNEPLLEKVLSPAVFFGDNASPVRVENGIMMDFQGKAPVAVIDVADMPIKGPHNMENAASAIIAARFMGVDHRTIAGAIRAFEPLAHRFETVGVFKGIEFIDDSKATNIDAAKRALESLKKKAVLLAGGIDKGGDYNTITALVREKVKAIVVIGEAREKIRDAFKNDVPVLFAETMSDAVKESGKIASQGEAVLLAPMCSSFDMFSGYKERGEVFQKEVRAQYGN